MIVPISYVIAISSFLNHNCIFLPLFIYFFLYSFHIGILCTYFLRSCYIQKIHNNSELPKRKSKKNPLTKNDKKNNRRLAGERVINENVIGMLKRFKILADKYRNNRNRRKRFGLRLNLISGVYNFALP
ncbi:IS5 family transposase ISOt6 [Orientia tsutsugamushi str. Gilliam]|uniref:IS5 family transposase ISOt6 n=1 Tax=Orientia tsutsugamushi str. Gilliam TaxID=1359184 RepID=A0A2U3QP22_ORITS|nr:IS5 family transposase ISOt6 [Orientia tsutsugamushi str. Gilliam]